DRQANMSRVFEAMGHGALDVVDTPALGVGNPKDAAAPLLRKILNIGWLIGQRGSRVRAEPTLERSTGKRQRLVAIGSSAGGPAALEILLKGLPRDFPAAIVLVQHVDQVFAAGMAEWLSSASGLPVRLAREGEPPQSGVVLLAGTNPHIRLLANGTLAYTAEPVNEIYRPSIDVFFESVARYWNGDAVGVLLTGMGRDGAEGLKLLREQNYLTIAQDQQSSAVYGMPKAAAAIDAAVEIRPLDRIAPRLVEVFAQ
ncbi:chemotaxis protein CheY, partial [Pseudomonas fluorescens ABAC62]